MTSIILDPHWRSIDELFSANARKELGRYNIIWGRDDPIPQTVLQDALPKADILIAATPVISQETLANAPNLKAVIEVSGAFPDTIDYDACAKRGVEVLSCAPGFRSAVAEMGLAMTLGACRGLVREHEAFRGGTERWLDDCGATDFTLFGANIGFVGFGQIAQEMTRLLAPFSPQIAAYDPWLPPKVANQFGVELLPLRSLAQGAKVLFVTAVPTADNKGLIDADILAAMPDQSLLVILSRAHLVDFAAVKAEAKSGRIAVASDVFPTEPLAKDDELRRLPNVILSPHRAAAVAGGRHLIGDLILKDLASIIAGQPTRELTIAQSDKIASLAGIGDAVSVANMAAERS